MLRWASLMIFSGSEPQVLPSEAYFFLIYKPKIGGSEPHILGSKAKVWGSEPEFLDSEPKMFSK